MRVIALVIAALLFAAGNSKPRPDFKPTDLDNENATSSNGNQKNLFYNYENNEKPVNVKTNVRYLTDKNDRQETNLEYQPIKKEYREDNGINDYNEVNSAQDKNLDTPIIDVSESDGNLDGINVNTQVLYIDSDQPVNNIDQNVDNDDHKNDSTYLGTLAIESTLTHESDKEDVGQAVSKIKNKIEKVAKKERKQDKVVLRLDGSTISSAFQNIEEPTRTTLYEELTPIIALDTNNNRVHSFGQPIKITYNLAGQNDNGFGNKISQFTKTPNTYNGQITNLKQNVDQEPLPPVNGNGKYYRPQFYPLVDKKFRGPKGSSGTIKTFKNGNNALGGFTKAGGKSMKPLMPVNKGNAQQLASDKNAYGQQIFTDPSNLKNYFNKNPSDKGRPQYISGLTVPNSNINTQTDNEPDQQTKGNKQVIARPNIHQSIRNKNKFLNMVGMPTTDLQNSMAGGKSVKSTNSKNNYVKKNPQQYFNKLKVKNPNAYQSVNSWRGSKLANNNQNGLNWGTVNGNPLGDLKSSSIETPFWHKHKVVGRPKPGLVFISPDGKRKFPSGHMVFNPPINSGNLNLQTSNQKYLYTGDRQPSLLFENNETPTVKPIMYNYDKNDLNPAKFPVSNSSPNNLAYPEEQHQAGDYVEVSTSPSAEGDCSQEDCSSKTDAEYESFMSTDESTDYMYEEQVPIVPPYPNGYNEDANYGQLLQPSTTSQDNCDEEDCSIDDIGITTENESSNYLYGGHKSSEDSSTAHNVLPHLSQKVPLSNNPKTYKPFTWINKVHDLIRKIMHKVELMITNFLQY